jgi:hypothetical protein
MRLADLSNDTRIRMRSFNKPGKRFQSKKILTRGILM